MRVDGPSVVTRNGGLIRGLGSALNELNQVLYCGAQGPAVRGADNAVCKCCPLV